MRNIIYSFNYNNFFKIKNYFKLSNSDFQELFNIINNISMLKTSFKEQNSFLSSGNKEIIIFNNIVLKFCNFNSIASDFQRYFDGKLFTIKELFLDQYIFLFNNKIYTNLNSYYDCVILQEKSEKIFDYDLNNKNYLFFSKKWDKMFKLYYNEQLLISLKKQINNPLFDYKPDNAGFIDKRPIIFDW